MKIKKSNIENPKDGQTKLDFNSNLSSKNDVHYLQPKVEYESENTMGKVISINDRAYIYKSILDRTMQ